MRPSRWAALFFLRICLSVKWKETGHRSGWPALCTGSLARDAAIVAGQALVCLPPECEGEPGGAVWWECCRERAEELIFSAFYCSVSFFHGGSLQSPAARHRAPWPILACRSCLVEWPLPGTYLIIAPYNTQIDGASGPSAWSKLLLSIWRARIESGVQFFIGGIFSEKLYCFWSVFWKQRWAFAGTFSEAAFSGFAFFYRGDPSARKN